MNGTRPTSRTGRAARANAWWVVAGHIGHTFGTQNPILASNGLAVDVFIILSGFVIAKLIEEQRETYLRFITRRAFRLFPLYLAVLFASALLLAVPAAFWAEGFVVVVPLAIWAAAMPAANSALLGSSPLRYLGDRSYSVYLVHMLPICVGGWFTQVPFSLTAIVLLGTLALSHLTYRYIELPGMDLGKRVTVRIQQRRASIEANA